MQQEVIQALFQAFTFSFGPLKGSRNGKISKN